MKYIYSILLTAICILPILFNQTVYSLSATTITYLKDGIKGGGITTYKVDYHTLLDYSGATFNLKVDGERGDKTYTTNNSRVIVTDSQVFRDIVFKSLSKDNPNPYKIDAVKDSFNIDSVEMINGGQLNNYTLEPLSKRDSTFYPIPTETSPTTAELKIETVTYEN